MNKPNQVRELLSSTVPHLKHNPDKLHIFIEGGNLVATGARQNLSFEYRYQLIILVTDYADHSDSLMVPLLAWVASNQPELMTHAERRERGIRFRAEQLTNQTADIEISLELTERVRVSQQDGGVEVVHLPEPPLDPDAGINWLLYISGEQVLP